jgi:predicted RND superfamily exporter protein
MLPLTFAIVLSYGLVGWIGKDYDMPIAVCSSLALGLSIDFAIHFVQRSRAKLAEGVALPDVIVYMFGEPGRAITRNGVVIVIGFLPLALATLTPYVTVGVFFAILMTVSVATTLALLPALMSLFGRWLFAGGAVAPPAA